MNLRQKAKHFKWLYEKASGKTYPVVVKTIQPEHYKVSYSMDQREILSCPPQLLQTLVTNNILRQLRTLVWDKVETEKDIYSDRIIYSFDIWVN